MRGKYSTLHFNIQGTPTSSVKHACISSPSPCPPPCPRVEEKKIKSLVVIAEETVQKIGDLVIDAPIGVDVSKMTGETTKPIILKPVGQPTLTPKIIKDKLINEGFVRVKLIIENDDPEPCPGVLKCFSKELFIPVQDVREIKGIEQGDDVEEFTEIESLSAFGLPASPEPGQVGSKAKLIIKVILKVKIIIARPEIIKVPVC